MSKPPVRLIALNLTFILPVSLMLEGKGQRHG